MWQVLCQVKYSTWNSGIFHIQCHSCQNIARNILPSIFDLFWVNKFRRKDSRKNFTRNKHTNISKATGMRKCHFIIWSESNNKYFHRMQFALIFLFVFVVYFFEKLFFQKNLMPLSLQRILLQYFVRKKKAAWQCLKGISSLKSAWQSNFLRSIKRLSKIVEGIEANFRLLEVYFSQFLSVFFFCID